MVTQPGRGLQTVGGLAATKLVPPVLPARHVVRGGLVRSLAEAVSAPQTKVLLVSAPAGWGKTTLLASLGDPGLRREAHAREAFELVWLQLEAADRDPARFWAAVAHAVDRIRPGVAAEVTGVARATRGGADAVVPVLVNLLVDGPPLVIALDDYHLVGTGEIHAGVDLLLERLPPSVTLAFGTRGDPPLRLSRLRARGELVEVRSADLSFAPADAAVLLGEAAGGIDVERLCRRTEGWAAGLVLAGLSLRRTADPVAYAESFGGDDPLVADYLSDELLASFGEDERERLLSTSVVDRLSGPLVDHLTGRDGGGPWLAGLAAADQLLIPLDARRTWFRHHQLVLELLRADAARTLGDRLPELHRRAAAWFQRHGETELAVRHRVAAGDVSQAAGLVSDGLGWRLIADGEPEALSRILDGLGRAADDVTGCVLQAGWCAFLRNDIDVAEERLSRARAMRSDSLTEANPLFDALEMNLALGRGDVSTAVAIADPALASGTLSAQLSPMSTVAGLAYAWAGRLAQAREAMAVARRRARQDGVITNEVMASMFLALAEAEVGDREAARSTATRAIELAASRHLARYHRIAVAHAVRASATGDPAQAAADLDRALALSRRPLGILDEAYVMTVAADVRLTAGDPSGAELLRRARSLVAVCRDPGTVGARLARVLSRHGYEDAAPTSPLLVEQLTDRELAVLRHLPSRLNQREIAAALYISLNTVKTHARSLFRKLGVNGRKQAVQRARELGLL
ncbi:LuxR C-terminal-related transcriptional regulator [Actinocorallia sp. B10E7]|uniref:LuxR C-terminal-related transcriptional regulator n=1 Tax=Actinocorallia sp. B10E7 TaxID=3153558 RepID=UPI00325CE6AC